MWCIYLFAGVLQVGAGGGRGGLDCRDPGGQSGRCSLDGGGGRLQGGDFSVGRVDLLVGVVDRVGQGGALLSRVRRVTNRL